MVNLSQLVYVFETPIPRLIVTMPGADTPWKEITLHFSTEHTKQHSIGETLWLGFYMSPWKGNRCFNSINRKVSGPYDSVDSKKLQSSHSAWDQIGYCGIILPPYYLICVTYFQSLTPTYRIRHLLSHRRIKGMFCISPADIVWIHILPVACFLQWMISFDKSNHAD